MSVLSPTDFLPSEALKASNYIFLRVKKWFPNMLFWLDSPCIIVPLFSTRPIWQNRLKFFCCKSAQCIYWIATMKKAEIIREVLHFSFDFCECYRCLGIKLSLSFVLRQFSLMRNLFFYLQCRNQAREGWSRAFLCCETFSIAKQSLFICSPIRDKGEENARNLLSISCVRDGHFYPPHLCIFTLHSTLHNVAHN